MPPIAGVFQYFQLCVHARDCTTNSRQVSLNRNTGQIMHALDLATRHDFLVHAKNLTTPVGLAARHVLSMAIPRG